jgi:KDO2-lipid IV(A) lauroyltransferase
MATGKLLALLPLSVLYVLSDGLYFILKYLVQYRKAVIMKNLAIAFPEKTKAEHEKIRSGFYRNFADILIEAIKSLSISRSKMKKRFRLRNPEVFEDLYANGKGVMMVMGHYANFEWTAMNIPLWVPHPCFAVYHPLKNQHFNKTIVQIREQFGLQLFEMKNTYPFMLNNPEERPLYVFMADQSPHRGKIKYYAPFFGVDTPVHLGVENLAKKCDLAVVFVSTHRMGRGDYELEARLLFEDAQQTEEYEITHKHMKVLEDIIREQPEDWLWSHKRWKHAMLEDASSHISEA